MSLRETLSRYISISKSPSAIAIDAVFQGNYSPEAWLETIKSINLDEGHTRGLTRLINRVLEKPVEVRRDMAEKICEPKLRIYIQKDADKELESDENARRFMVYLLSCSNENLKNMREALENILQTKRS